MESSDKDIRQFFQEMRALDKDIAPSFEETFEMARRKPALRRQNLRRIAAVLLITGAGLSAYVFNQRQAEGAGGSPVSISEWQSPLDFSVIYSETRSISSWKSPTDFSMLAGSPESIDLDNWQSPTDFLLKVSN